jgi:hypothetical protein
MLAAWDPWLCSSVSTHLSSWNVSRCRTVHLPQLFLPAAAHGNFVDNLAYFYTPRHGTPVDGQVAVPTYLVVHKESYRSYRGKRVMDLAELSERNDVRNNTNNGTNVIEETPGVNDTHGVKGLGDIIRIK